MTRPSVRAYVAAMLMVSSGAATGDWTLDIETGALWLSRNDVQIPNNSQGDRFDLLDLTGKGPDPYLRLKLERDWGERHTVTGLYAPVRTSGTGTFDTDVNFAGETFVAGAPVRASYQFNTYRIGYRYTWRETDRWRLRIGGSLLIRNANIRLQQDGRTAEDPDLGVVPLLAFEATRFWTPRWSTELDVEGLGAPEGRAIDASLSLNYLLNEDLSLRAGYRTLEGGADNGSVYTFAWLHYGLIGVRYGF
ncbi:hypothetical protein DIT71_16050 [Marinobacter vulgaris]|uniref:DUF2490 domain-containing protein n=1 Tax=Marinobacter vulgaris TaxID=1928331 RepID=A0A2V3ZH95_9GAMM|nr:hypothetical protein [Marinobacter vulgaris]PXX89088.1 hypothetical protein DIT71_16050 [Marinobacter vulgaris]TSJ67471.1 hypothetical protein FPC41_16525 [Marinobacter vulgaris]